MKSDQIRIAVAESLGTHRVTHTTLAFNDRCEPEPCVILTDKNGNQCHKWKNRTSLDRDFIHPKAYDEDLNACAEMEAGFHKDFEASEQYAYHLKTVVYKTKHSGVGINFAVLNATAPQRCEAYLRTKGIWRDKDV